MFAIIHPHQLAASPPGPQPWRGGMLWLVAFVHVMLFVPQFTGFLFWSDHKMHLLPFPPVLWLGFFGALHLMLTIPQQPAFSKFYLALLVLLLVRVLDVGLQRFGGPNNLASYLIRTGMTVGFSIFATTACGASLKAGKQPLIITAIVSIIVSTGANLAEMAGVFQNSSVDGRAAGFIPDANDSAIAIVCMLALLLTLSKHFWLNAVMICIAFIGVFPTFSRSGFLVFALITISFLGLNFKAHAAKIVVFLATFFVLGAGAVTVMTLSPAFRKDANVQDRMNAIFGGDTKKMESSERMKDLSDGIDGALTSPIVGLGTGAGTFKYVPHNQFVSLWVDLGLFGALYYTFLLCVLLYKSITQPAAALLCAIPVIAFLPFSQTLVDTGCYWLIAILGALLSSRQPLTLRLLRPPTFHPHVLPA